MLEFDLRLGEGIILFIPDDANDDRFQHHWPVEIELIRLDRGGARLGIEAAPDISIFRNELLDKESGSKHHEQH
jgi:hypothetical protein